MITIGSCFSGIGGFELGLERAIPNSTTIWQIEQDPFCQSVLARHWPSAVIHQDIRQVSSKVLPYVDIMCGGFPCQDISIAGKQEGINGKKSGLWWEMHRLIGEIRPRVIVLENVAAIIQNGLSTVSESLAQLGYDLEWQIISARQFGAPHIRKRWFGVAYPNHQKQYAKPINAKVERAPESDAASAYPNSHRIWLKQHNQTKQQEKETQPAGFGQIESAGFNGAAHSNSEHITKQSNMPSSMAQSTESECSSSQAGWIHPENYWHQNPPKPTLCDLDDGIPNRVARLKALGNAIVPQCSQYIGSQILKAGII
tara:strand:+ start:714 stop:1652 length:939 start_codon:yes stop_codon:yes gene_type:complete